MLLRRPLWYDEVFTVWASRLRLPRLLDVLRTDSGPPLLYLVQRPLGRLAEQLGLPDRIARLPELVATLILLALGVWTLSSRRSRLLFASFAAASPFFLLYAAEARAYALIALLDLLLFLLVRRCVEKRGHAAAIALVGALALYTHYLAILFLAALVAASLLERRRAALLGLAGAAVLFLPWLPILLSQPPEATSWMKESIRDSAAQFLAALGGAGRVPAPFGAPLPLSLMVLGAPLESCSAWGSSGRHGAIPMCVLVASRWP